MTRKKLMGWGVAVAALAIAVIQFVPAPPLVIPAELPAGQRSEHRLLNFEGIPNFRDLGGYTTVEGRVVKWGKLYRAGTFAEASRADLAGLQRLGLAKFIDFRSAVEKEEEPDILPVPPGFEVIEIPILDEGNKALVGDITKRIESGKFEGFDPDQFMLTANRQFASGFTPEFGQFVHTVLDASGAPVLWHCTAGKDRTGFAAAVLLRILGVPQETVLQDYMASLQPALDSRRAQLLMLRVFKGGEAADKLAVLLGVEESWLRAAFDEIDNRWGNFDNYVQNGLGLNKADVQRLRTNLLE